MSRKKFVYFGLVLLLSTAPSYAGSFGTVINGGLKITGAGTGLMFPDGTSQSTATLQGQKGDTGSQGIQGIQGLKGDKGDPGIQGLPGASGKWVICQMIILNTGAGINYTYSHNYDTSGRETGTDISTFGSTSKSMTINTAFDSHDNPIEAISYGINSGPPTSITTSTFTYSYVYDNIGRISSKTQNQNSNGNTFTSQYVYAYEADNSYTVTMNSNNTNVVWKYDEKNNILNYTYTSGNNTHTDTYAYYYDSNGNPFYAKVSVTGNTPGLSGYDVYITWKRL
jgi:hypothetical protein